MTGRLPDHQRDGWWEKVLYWVGEKWRIGRRKSPIERVDNVGWNYCRGTTQCGRFSSL